jgi:hypothetical protein
LSLDNDSTKGSSNINIKNKGIYSIALPPKLSTLHDTYGKWLFLTQSDHEIIDIFLAASLDRYIGGDPVWLFLVAVSSGWKTELIRSIIGLPSVYSLSSLTSKTFISGKVAKKKEGEEEVQISGILKDINGKVLVIKDFTVILSLATMERDEIFSQLRDIYDGFMEKAFGNFPEPIRIKCKMGLIAGVTPVIDHYQKLQTLLGERFLKVRSSNIDCKEVAKKASKNSGHETAMRKELSEAVQNFLIQVKRQEFQLTDEQRDEIIDCAQYICLMRTWVYIKFSYRGEIIDLEKAEPESPARVAKQLTKLANLLALVRGHDKIEDEDLVTVKRVARDTALPKRQKIVEALIKLKGSASRTTVAIEAKMHFKTVNAEVERMISLDILTGYNDNEGGTCCFTFDFQKLSDIVNGSWEAR